MTSKPASEWPIPCGVRTDQTVPQQRGKNFCCPRQPQQFKHHSGSMRLDPGRKSGWIRAWSIYLFTIQAAVELQAECWCWFWLQESSLPAAVFIVITIVARFLGGTSAKKTYTAWLIQLPGLRSFLFSSLGYIGRRGEIVTYKFSHFCMTQSHPIFQPALIYKEC